MNGNLNHFRCLPSHNQARNLVNMSEKEDEERMRDSRTQIQTYIHSCCPFWVCFTKNVFRFIVFRLSVCLSVCLCSSEPSLAFVHLSKCFKFFVCLSVCLSVCHFCNELLYILHFFPSAQNERTLINGHPWLHRRREASLSVFLLICLSVYLLVCLSFVLFLFLQSLFVTLSADFLPDCVRTQLPVDAIV